MNIFFAIIILLTGIISLIIGILSLSKNISLLTNEYFTKFFLSQKFPYWIYFILGIVITALAQSSNLVSIISLSLLSQKVLSKKQTLLIIVGSNIGTTITSIIVGFNFKYIYIIFFIVGTILYYIKKKRKVSIIGLIIFSLGLIYFGLEAMEKGVGFVVLETSVINSFFNMSNNTFIFFLYGIFLSALIQSSAASIALIQNLFHINLISLAKAISFVLGANVGTTFTSFVVGITKNKDVFIVSLLNLFFNLISAIIFLLIINPFAQIITSISYILSINKFHMVSLGHILFNLIGSLFFLFIILLYKERVNVNNQK